VVFNPVYAPRLIQTFASWATIVPSFLTPVRSLVMIGCFGEAAVNSSKMLFTNFTGLPSFRAKW
jgi:hypothetical protein